jgi:hypothetical protein
MEQQAVLHRATTSCQLDEMTLDFKTVNHCQDSSVCETLSVDNMMRTVSVSHFVTEQDIMDESEYEEIIANIEQIFSPFGDLESITIMVMSSTDAPHENTKTREEDDTLDRECIAFITFLLGDAAAAATTAINGSLTNLP